MANTHHSPPQPLPQARRTPPSAKRRRPPKRRSKLLSALMLVAVGLVALVAGALTFLLIAPPTDALKAQAIAAVKAHTGRDLAIAGPVRLTLYPGLGVSLASVSLSAPPEMGGAPTLAMESLEVTVKTLPLLRREVVVDRLVLNKPVLDLRVDGQGRKSWELAADGTARPTRLATARPTARDADAAEAEIVVAANAGGGAATGSGRASSLDQLALGDVRIVDGSVHYADERSGDTQQIGAINLQLALAAIASPLVAKGSYAWHGETIALDGTLTTPKAVLEGQQARVAARIDSARIALGYDGALTLAEAIALEGRVSAKTDSVRALARWLGQRLPRAKGFGPMSLDGQLKVAGTTLTLADTNLALDGATAAGTVAVEASGARPLVRANLRMSELDLNQYMASKDRAEGGQRAGKRAAGAHDAAAPAASAPAPGIGNANSIEELIQQSGPKVKGYVQRSGWSDEPIDLEILGLVDAEARLALGGLEFNEIKVGATQLAVTLKGKVMRTDFEEVQLYEGKGRGSVTVDATGEAAAIATNLAVDGVAAHGLLKDAVEIGWLSGTGKLTLAVSGRGASQRQLIDTLAGKAELAFADGAITGFNLAQTMRSLSQGQFTGLKSGPTEKTDFSELSASFDIRDGIADNNDLKLASPLLRVSGAGKIMLPAQELDYLAKPKLVASLSGQGGETGGGGLEVPVKIEGPWAKPSIKPDVRGLLKDPSKALEAAKEIGKKLKGKNADELIKGVLGGDGKSKPSLGQFLNR
ncbi:MAG: AsmA family protein [Pseudomonadota bacterium]